jgi:predicted small secreted protein
MDSQGKKKFSLGMALGVAVGMIVYRVLIGG